LILKFSNNLEINVYVYAKYILRIFYVGSIPHTSTITY